MKKQILNFINEFKQYEKSNVLVNTFTQGYCYYFALILNERFNGEIIYLKEVDHFVFKKDDYLFDITGNVTKKYKDCKIVDWQNNKTIIRQCITKENPRIFQVAKSIM